MESKNQVAWLIEYRDPALKQTTGYVMDIDRDDTFQVKLTRDSSKAIKFGSRYSAEAIINDNSFIHAMGSDHNFVVEEHLFLGADTTGTTDNTL